METELSLRVAELKERFKKIGMASYHISGLSEEASLLSYLREKDSFRYALVRDPYARSKNLVWRLMKVDIWRPSIPMGYFGAPGFIFDYMGATPALNEAIKLVDIVTGRRYQIRKMKDESWERISMKAVRDDFQPLSVEDKAFLKQRNFVKITVGGKEGGG